ncbi:MAG: hypothetical protein ACOC2W_01235 [bacterium]
MSKNTVLRTCASCEWIFRKGIICPKCGFSSYGAHWVYGKKCYEYAKNQYPWYKKKMDKYALTLFQEIDENNKMINNKEKENKNEKRVVGSSLYC